MPLSRDEHPRTLDDALGDGIAQRDIEERSAPDIADRSEAGLDGGAGVGNRAEGAGRHAFFEALKPQLVIAVRKNIHRQVGVRVDEPG